MTYCVGLRLDRGLVFMSDTRTNAGIDDIAMFRKMHSWSTPGNRVITLLTAGNLATTQAVVSLLDERSKAPADRNPTLLEAPSMFQVARIVGVYPLADDDPRWRHDVRAQLKGALTGGARVVQLRLKHTKDGAALELARWAVERAHGSGALLIVNDRFDLADLAGADGVHVGGDDLAPERIPTDVRARLLVGLSTHTLEQVRAARDRPVDYIGFGPVFGTRSKASEYSARGSQQLREAVGLVGLPVVAIGGIGSGRIAEVATAGARAAAVISAVANADDPAAATRKLQAEFDKAR